MAKSITYRCSRCRKEVQHGLPVPPGPTHCGAGMLRVIGKRTTVIVDDGTGWPDDDERRR